MQIILLGEIPITIYINIESTIVYVLCLAFLLNKFGSSGFTLEGLCAFGKHSCQPMQLAFLPTLKLGVTIKYDLILRVIFKEASPKL